MADSTPRQPRLKPLDLVATVAHELKSPLVFISGLAEMLRQQQLGKLSPAQRAYVARMGGASDRLLQLVENLLLLNKSHHGRLSLTLEPVAVVSVITKALDELQPRLVERQMSVVWSGQIHMPPVLVDEAILYQVLFNLLDNTIKYSPAGTNVTFKFKRGPHSLAVQVRDQGFGIKPSDLDKLFERFGMVNQPISAQASSSGLGLFIVKSLVELMGGRVTAKRLRRGTAFTINLPIAHQLELFTPPGKAENRQLTAKVRS